MTRGAISFGVAFLVSFLLTPFVLGGVALTILDRGCVSIGKPVIFQAASAPARDSASPPAARPTRAEGAPVRLMIFGPTLGFLEPCGCTGGQTGGLSRRKTLLDAATTQDPTLVVLDAGELLRGAGPLERIRGETAASVYRDMKVGAVAVGKNDLAAGETELRAQIHGHPSVLTAKGAGEPILRASIVSRV
ncbi:MAG TPA: hypothetical protein VKE69_01875, partial [Planctomycetota bacterium]|nr:hypothetical protein [Planctomycetota bacterium]